MVVRDEGDVIEEVLCHVAGWCHRVYVLDTGSQDSTWEIVCRLARDNPRIVPVESRAYTFNDGIRSYLFERYRSDFRDGDWICKLDADEFYACDPRPFIDGLRWWEGYVCLQWQYYRYTALDHARWKSGVETLASRADSIWKRRRYYTMPTYGEIRMFRYRSSMRWPPTRNMPYNPGYPAARRIGVQHYPHRDPVQMARRFEIRAEVARLTDRVGFHWKEGDWENEVLPVEMRDGRLYVAGGDTTRSTIANGHFSDRVFDADHPEETAQFEFRGHLPNGFWESFKLFLKEVLLVRLLDRLRPRYPMGHVTELRQEAE